MAAAFPRVPRRHAQSVLAASGQPVFSAPHSPRSAAKRLRIDQKNVLELVPWGPNCVTNAPKIVFRDRISFRHLLALLSVPRGADIALAQEGLDDAAQAAHRAAAPIARDSAYALHHRAAAPSSGQDRVPWRGPQSRRARAHRDRQAAASERSRRASGRGTALAADPGCSPCTHRRFELRSRLVCNAGSG